MSKTDLIVVALLLPAVAGLTVARGGVEEAQDLVDWWRGPIHYIADKREVKTFRALESDEDRALYVSRFWARRDPTPGSIANEYRQMFWERVRDSNDLFIDSHKDGWRTDRGKIYILYGPPNHIEDRLHLKSGGNLQTSPGIIRWLYEGRPGARTDVDPMVVVAFERYGNEYKLSIDPKLTSVFFDPLTVREETPSQRMAEQLFSRPKVSELAVMLDMGKMQEVPPQAQVILEHVETIESYRTRPIRVEIDRFRHPDRAGALTLLTVDVTDTSAGVAPVVIARFAPHDATQELRMLGEDSFRTVDNGQRRIAQGRLVLDEGVYEVTVMVVDPAQPVPGLLRQTLRIDVLAPGMRLSDVVWAAELETLRYAGLASHDEPFQVGPFRVVPLLGDSYRPGETARLFYEIYGGQPPYRISYTLQGQENDGSWVTLGRPSSGEQTGSAQAWELPSSEKWPLGAYRIQIDVQDSEDRAVSFDKAFKLSADEAEGSD